jgi:hypothetical protein
VAEVKEKELRATDDPEIEEVEGGHVAVTESQRVRAALKGEEVQEVRVDSHVLVLHHAARTAAPDMFTRETFEGTLDKVSRPVRGKYADVPTSSEEFARRKQEEIDLEERR